MKYKYINIFLFYSILGNIFERVTMYFLDRDYVSGFMGSIFTPIYGIAILIVLFIHNRIKIKNRFLRILIEFFIYCVVLTILEFIGGILIENVFNKIFWNYDKFKYNLGIYVSLETTLVWGLLSIFVLYIIHPIFMKLESYIPKFISILFSIIFLINLFCVLIQMT